MRFASRARIQCILSVLVITIGFTDEGGAMKHIFIIFILLGLSIESNATWLVQKSGQRVRVRYSDHKLEGTKKVIKSFPAIVAEGFPISKDTYEEILYRDDALPLEYQKYIVSKDATWPGSEVRTLVKQGPPSNRIDLTIVGDGYTSQEKERFFNDASRITNELFASKTFASYLPLFNVYAVFVPSNESGLSDLVEKDTALGLYRSPPGSKRAIMPGKYGAIEKALSLAPAPADYPIIVSNDDFYGGLGGEYAITTRSEASGIVVLRHELGHNFGSVGEEYDDGYVYSGANSSISSDVPWKAWLNEKNNPEVYEIKKLSGDYIWQNLKNKPYSAKFQFPPGDYSLNIQVSAVGWESNKSVQVTLDNQPLTLEGVFSIDRSFFDINTSPTSGVHLINAHELIPDGDNVLAYIRAYAVPNNTNKEVQHVAAYATFDENGGKTYRPTYDTCIMRNMLSKEFCNVDKENFWFEFLNRVSLIDDLKISVNEKGFKVEVFTPPLKGIVYSWYKISTKGEEKIAEGESNKLELGLSEKGSYRVDVEFRTPEVRNYNNNFRVNKEFKL